MSTTPIDASIRRPSVLQSWKEIASYLGRGVRTVQRYEIEFGLPVRRLNAKGKSSVMALKEDIDLWLRTTTIEYESTEESHARPLVSETRESRSRHENLRLEMHALCVAHRDAAGKLQSTLQKLVGQIISKKIDA